MTGILRVVHLDSPVGRLRATADDDALRTLTFEDASTHAAEAARTSAASDGAVDGSNEILASLATQLEEYFAGTRREFDLPLDPSGTEFQLATWEVLRTIPYGATMSYGEQARRLGDVRKSRAVGAANGRNPISIVVPCHRVVSGTGNLTGFGGGIENKAWLLAHERQVLSGDTLPFG
ncbi:MAG TPA: methylated-DNA--[protein]-cysteine S-methyltransferase [Propionibacteriaceae bacterium]|nr:methylated-DNA--[protein]-cysteine S-methyltransferase [Propionibacteriaceae bacterium]